MVDSTIEKHWTSNAPLRLRKLKALSAARFSVDVTLLVRVGVTAIVDPFANDGNEQAKREEISKAAEADSLCNQSNICAVYAVPSLSSLAWWLWCPFNSVWPSSVHSFPIEKNASILFRPPPPTTTTTTIC